MRDARTLLHAVHGCMLLHVPTVWPPIPGTVPTAIWANPVWVNFWTLEVVQSKDLCVESRLKTGQLLIGPILRPEAVPARRSFCSLALFRGIRARTLFFLFFLLTSTRVLWIGNLSIHACMPCRRARGRSFESIFIDTVLFAPIANTIPSPLNDLGKSAVADTRLVTGVLRLVALCVLPIPRPPPAVWVAPLPIVLYRALTKHFCYLLSPYLFDYLAKALVGRALVKLHLVHQEQGPMPGAAAGSEQEQGPRPR